MEKIIFVKKSLKNLQCNIKSIQEPRISKKKEIYLVYMKIQIKFI